MPILDPHSFADAEQPQTRHLTLRLTVDFTRRVLAGEAVLRLDRDSGGPLDLDTRSLTIRSVRCGGREVAFTLHEETPILGQKLSLNVPAGESEVTIAYETSPDSSALQWLSPEQTAGKRQPFLFSQCQAIHARALAPLQDTPRRRITYDAELTIPAALTAVMSAGPAAPVGAHTETKVLAFHMPQPIAPYLLALAVGDLEARDLSPRSRVYAEPATVDAAASEFSEVEAILEAAEKLFGPYDWDRFDMLVLPPSFPYGGMENPRITFLTPTLLAGDRSLVAVVAHELAHSWTGNLITNATAEHFWLNEGFTVWAERRIVEAVWGQDAVLLAWANGAKALEGSLSRYGKDSPLTKLKTDLVGVDPDDAISQIPYEKGARLLVLMERFVGRERWDRFVREYMDRFRFSSITSYQFLAFLEEKLPGTPFAVRAEEWLYTAGLPDNAPAFPSAALDAITSLASGFTAGERPAAEVVARWSPGEMVLYLQNLPRVLSSEDCAWLDANLALTGRGNHEILVEWLTVAAGSDYEPAFPRIREVLLGVGRVKYLRPLYSALGRHPRTQALARDCYAAARPGYHGLSRRVVEQVIAGY
ncbi:MAG: M1 family metallopeptidase [Acidobacteria bacterium]|nr:M1 family metallopeptidase [Acidobacteriota bacterium]